MENYKDQVLSFIYNFVGKSDELENVFASGYCYYFAVMLKEAFNRGEVCWVKDLGHIVWKDIDNTAYDIYGEFDDYDELIPAKNLYAGLLDFKHNGIETPDYKKTMKVHNYYREKGIKLRYDKIKEIAKENEALVFAKYDIITNDPFQIVYYTLLDKGEIKEDENA